MLSQRRLTTALFSWQLWESFRHVRALGEELILTAEDMKEIATALAEFEVHGGRMNAEQMTVVERRLPKIRQA